MLLPSEKRPIFAVTGSQKPYIFDLPQLLSLPNGFEFRFRYRHRWVEDSLIKGIDSDSAIYAGREIIILFHSQESKRLVPIRRGTVIKLESIGPMIFVRFRVGEFVKVNLDIKTYLHPAPGVTDNAINELSSKVSSLVGRIGGVAEYNLAEALPAGWYLRTADQPLSDETWDNGDATTAWSRLVAVLHGEHSLRGIPFFYLLGFQTETGKRVKPAAIQNRFSITREEIHGFHLLESERYRMRMVEWCEHPLGSQQPPVRVSCEFNTANLALEGSSDLVVGRYDIIEFTFLALKRGYSEIGIRSGPVEKKNEANAISAAAQGETKSIKGAPAWAEWPTIFAARVPILVRPRVRKFFVTLLATIIGLGLYIFVAPNFEQQWKSVVEIIGLGFIFFAYREIAEYLESIFKINADIVRLRAGSEMFAKKGGE